MGQHGQGGIRVLSFFFHGCCRQICFAPDLLQTDECPLTMFLAPPIWGYAKTAATALPAEDRQGRIR
jgi:hypothetical protein